MYDLFTTYFTLRLAKLDIKLSIPKGAQPIAFIEDERFDNFVLVVNHLEADVLATVFYLYCSIKIEKPFI